MARKNPERPWATGVIVTAGAISLSFNTRHSVTGTELPLSLALLYGGGPIVLAAMQSHVVALQAARGELIGHWRRIFTFGLVMGALALSFLGIYDLLRHAVPDPLPATGWNEPAVLTPIVVDLMALAALHELLRPAERLSASPKAPQNRRHVICSGSTGVLFLRRPTPAHRHEPVAPAGTRVLDLNPLLAGPHPPVVYFVRNGDQVQIGMTRNLRLCLCRLCLRVDDIALVLHGGQDYERHLHQRFAGYRIGDSTWFELAGELAAFVATGGDMPWPSSGAGSADSMAPATGESRRQDAPAIGANSGASSGDGLAPVRRRRPARGGAGTRRRNTRRSMDEWVELATPIFHAEFQRLKRQPTGHEFADAIKRAKLGTVSASTAKNIRTEILDRSPLPTPDDLAK